MMGQIKRSPFQQEVVEALIESKAIDYGALGGTISKFAERAALEGEPVVIIINRWSTWACGWPGPELNIPGLERQLEG